MKWNETQWMRRVWGICGIKFVAGEKTGETQKKSTQIPFRPPRNPRGGTEMRTQNPNGGRRAANCLHHRAARLLHNIIEFITLMFHVKFQSVYRKCTSLIALHSWYCPGACRAWNAREAIASPDLPDIKKNLIQKLNHRFYCQGERIHLVLR